MIEQFEKDGILIIEDFLTKEEVSSIRNVSNMICEIYILTLYNTEMPVWVLAEDHDEDNDRSEIHQIVEQLDPLTDRGVFSTTGCQQVGRKETSHYNSDSREKRRELL